MSPLLTPDFSEVVELKPGSYKARFADVKSVTSNAGKLYLRWTLEVVENENTALNGRKFTTNTMLDGKGAGRLKQLVRATLDPAYDGGEVNTDDILGKVVGVVLKEGKNQDGTTSDFPEVAAMTRA